MPRGLSHAWIPQLPAVMAAASLEWTNGRGIAHHVMINLIIVGTTMVAINTCVSHFSQPTWHRLLDPLPSKSSNRLPGNTALCHLQIPPKMHSKYVCYVPQLQPLSKAQDPLHEQSFRVYLPTDCKQVTVLQPLSVGTSCALSPGCLRVRTL